MSKSKFDYILKQKELDAIAEQRRLAKELEKKRNLAAIKIQSHLRIIPGMWVVLT